MGGMSFRAISRATNCSRSVVTEYISKFKKSKMSYSEIAKLSDSLLLEKLNCTKKEQSNRYKVLYDRFPVIKLELTKAGVKLHTLWEEYKEENPDGYSYSQFCYHYQMYKETFKTTMHMDYKAGERLFVDFAGKKLSIYDSKTNKFQEVEVFVALLAASQYTYVEATYNQKQETFVRCTENALWYFGGVPKSIMPDCLKSGVTKYHIYEPEINSLYADFAQHYDTVIYPARPGKPKDKSLVEGAVKIAYTRIYAQLRHNTFYSLQELNKAILNLLEKYNTIDFQQLKMSRKQLFEQSEQKALKPLPLDLYCLKSFLKLKVGYNYHIFLSKDKHYYSVPYKYVHKKVEVRYSDKTVEIYYENLRVASHIRDRTPKGYTTIKEHMPQSHQKEQEKSTWTDKRFINWAEAIGINTSEVIEIILNRKKYSQQAYNICLGILNQEKKYNRQKLEKACKKALYLNSISYKTISNILKNNLENEEEPDLFSKLPEHNNIRGSKYYIN
jgi:transposase